MIQKADAAHMAADRLGGLSAFTTTPLLISILVRAGDTDIAIATVEKIPAKEAATAWSAFATACTLEGKTDAVQRLIDESKSDRLKALLCAGVVIGFCQPRKIAIADLGPLVRDYAFQQDPKLNPLVQFDLKEIDVSGLWNTLHIQLFLARYLGTGGTQFNERLLICCDGQLTPFANSFGGHGLVSAVVVDDSLYYTDSYGSGREFSQIGRVSLDGRRIRIVESAVYDITAVPVPICASKTLAAVSRWKSASSLPSIPGRKGGKLAGSRARGRHSGLSMQRARKCRKCKSNGRPGPPRSSEAIRPCLKPGLFIARLKTAGTCATAVSAVPAVPQPSQLQHG